MDSGSNYEIAMRLESTPGGAETLTRLAQVQLQLAILSMQLQDMAKTKVVREHIWCTTCRSEGNHKDECHVLCNYVVIGIPSPFPTWSQM
jgi:hypothetical protein